MSGNHEDQKQDAVVRVELKYCEHCGGLWLRECGAGTVYCESCTQRSGGLTRSEKETGAADPAGAPAHGGREL